MTFEQVLETVASSEVENWWTDSCWGANSGPSYRDHFESWELYEGVKHILKVKSHSNVATYKPDVSITIAWGLESLDNFREEWANKFPNPRASSSFIDIFYNGALVFRDIYVEVDGGRARLPLPTIKWDDKQKKITELTVPLRRYRLIGLVDSLDHVSQYDSYFQQAGFKVVDTEWPS